MGGAFVDLLHPLPLDGDVRALLHPAGDGGAEGVTVHGQRTAGGHAGLLGGGQELAAHPAHLLFEQTGRGIQPFGFQAVGADQLRKALALMGRGKMGGLLLVERDLHALARQPQRRLAARKASTQYGNFIILHLVNPFISSRTSSSQQKLSHSAKGSPIRGAGNAKY